MPSEAYASNHYAVQPHPHPTEAFGYRTFESALDFPDPPPFNNGQTQTTYQGFESNESDNWLDGFLQSPPEPEDVHEELPETFVGMSTTLSPQERDQLFASHSGYANSGPNTFQVAATGTMSQLQRNIQYSGTQFSDKPGEQNRVPFGYENIDPMFAHTRTPYSQGYTMSQNYLALNNNNNNHHHHFFSTPPMSTYAPNFLQNSSLSGHASIHRSPQAPQRLQFGTDTNFEGHSFVAPLEQETPQNMVQRKMNHMECLKPEPSPASTHPSSPVLQKKNRQTVATPADTYHPEFQGPLLQAIPDVEQNPPSPSSPAPKRRKRRKTGSDSDRDFSTTRKSTRQPSKRAKTSSSKPSAKKKAAPTLQSPPAENSTPQPRPSDAKSNRTHLTEAQKKTNHIISEQKRRDLIKQGYEGIKELVPALKDLKYSKGAMLEAAADWLEDIVHCNGVLRAQLEGMRGGFG